MIAFRHCDPRLPFLWAGAAQPAARWHGAGDGPANYFADTPAGAWAEFLRHEGIVDAADLAGVRRSLWAVEIPDDGYAEPRLPAATLFGAETSYPDCRVEARRLRAAGAARLRVRGAALLPGGAGGWHASGTPGAARDGHVHVLFGACDAVGWPAVHAGRPPPDVLPLVRSLAT